MAGNGWDLPPGARGAGWQWSEPPGQEAPRWNNSSLPQQGGSGTVSPTLNWDSGNALHAPATRGWDAGSSQEVVSQRVSGRVSPQPNGWDSVGLQGRGGEAHWADGGGSARELLSAAALGTPGNRPKGHGWQDPNAREFVPARAPHAQYRTSGPLHTPPDTPHGRGWDLPPVSIGVGSSAGWQSPTLPQNSSWGSQHSMSPTARQPSPPSVTWDEESIRTSKSRVAAVARGGMALRPPGNRAKRGSAPAAPVYKGPIPTNRGWGFEKQTMLKVDDKRAYEDYESDRLSYRTAGSEFSNRAYGYGNVPPDDPVHVPMHLREAAYGAFPRPGSASSVGSGGREHINPGYESQVMQFERGPGYGLPGGRGGGWAGGPPGGRGGFEGGSFAGNRSRGAPPYLPEGNWPHPGDGRSAPSVNSSRYEDASSQFYNRGVPPWGNAGPLHGFRDPDYPSMAGSSAMGVSDSESDELDIASDDELEGFEGLAKEKEEKAYKKYRRVYLELLQEASKGDGAKDQWKCLVCKNRTKFWFNSLHALHQHAETKKNEWRIQHRGLARALRELLSRDPMGPLGILLPPVEDDDQIIVWPPAVILQNTRVRMDADGHWNGLGATEIRDQYKSFNPMAVRPAYGPDGHKGCVVVQFAADPYGFDKAVQLSQYFEKQSRGREGWESHGIRSKRFDEEGNLLVFGYLAQPKDMWQLDKFAKGKNGKAGQLVKWWTESKKEAVDDEKARREQQRLAEAGEVSRLREKAAEDEGARARAESELRVQSKKLRNLQERYAKMEQLQQQQKDKHEEELESQELFYDGKFKELATQFTATEQDALAKRREREASDAKRLSALETLKDGAEEEGEKARLEQQMESLEEEIAKNLTTAINHKDALGEMEMAHTEELLELRKKQREEELALRQRQQEQKAALLEKLELSARAPSVEKNKQDGNGETAKLLAEASETTPAVVEGGKTPNGGGDDSDGPKATGPKDDDSHAELVGKMLDEVLSEGGVPDKGKVSPGKESPRLEAAKSPAPGAAETGGEIASPRPKLAAPLAKGPLTKSRFVVLEDTPESEKTASKAPSDMLPRTLSLDAPPENLTGGGSPQGFRAYKSPGLEQQGLAEEGPAKTQALQQAVERLATGGGEKDGAKATPPLFHRSNSAGGAFGGGSIANGVLDAFSGGWEAPAASALDGGSASWADVAKKEEGRSGDGGAPPAGQLAGS